MRKVITLICLLLVALIVVGCASDEERLVGTWYFEDEPSLCMKFSENGTCVAYENGERASTVGRWYVDGNYLVVDGDRMRFSLNGNTLTFYYGNDSKTLKKGR